VIVIRRSPEREVDLLTKHYSGLVQRCRVEALGDKLVKRGPLVIVHCTRSWSGQRCRILLEDGTELRLKLYWARKVEPDRLCSVRWYEEAGWLAVVARASDEPVRLWAYCAELRSPRIR
jgi:hypothetical protein